MNVFTSSLLANEPVEVAVATPSELPTQMYPSEMLGTSLTLPGPEITPEPFTADFSTLPNF